MVAHPHSVWVGAPGGTRGSQGCCDPECFGRSSFDAYFYVSYLEVLTVLVHSGHARAPSQFVTVLFLFSGLLFRFCGRFPSAGSSSAGLVVLLASWFSRWFLCPPGVGFGLPSVFLVFLALVLVTSVDFAETSCFGRFRCIFRVARCPPGGQICGV